MRRFMARAIYTLTTPDGREVGAVFGIDGHQLVVQLDPAFHEATQARREDDGTPTRLVVVPVAPARRRG